LACYHFVFRVTTGGYLIMISKKNLQYSDAVDFHGHSCPGLAMGYRAAEVGLRTLFGSRSMDEEMVAIVENDACGVDAVQLITGCTSGKGNLVFRDYGKMAFTFFNRATGQGVRVYLEVPELDEQESSRFNELKQIEKRTETENKEMAGIMKKRTDFVLNLPEEDFIKTGPPLEKMPRKARLFESCRCEECGEKVMATRINNISGKSLCNFCGDKSKHA